MAVAVVLVLFLVVNGFLFYHYQASLPDTGNVMPTHPETVPSSLSTEETSSLLEQEEATTANETNIAEETISSPDLTTEESNGLRVDVRVVGANAWLRVQEDGRIVMDGQAPPGFSRRFEADQEIRIRTGNAGATWVEANGRAAGPLGASGQVGTWTFT